MLCCHTHLTCIVTLVSFGYRIRIRIICVLTEMTDDKADHVLGVLFPKSINTKMNEVHAVGHFFYKN